jgi:hypothetical protein
MLLLQLDGSAAIISSFSLINWLAIPFQQEIYNEK